MSVDVLKDDSQLQGNRKTAYMCHLSKKRFAEIQSYIQSVVNDENTAQVIMDGIKTITHYDPDAKTYDKSKAEKMRKYRQDREKKLKELEQKCKKYENTHDAGKTTTTITV